MDERYRPSMDPFNRHHKAPVPEWLQESESGSAQHEHLIRRISELEQQIETYESLLNELPEMFERKFQQRLEPFLERYRLLAEQSEESGQGNPPLLHSSDHESLGNLVRFPAFRLPAFLQTRRRSA